MAEYSFDDLAAAISSARVRYWCPGGQCRIEDERGVSKLAHLAIKSLTELPAYDLGQIPTALGQVSDGDLEELVASGRYRVPEPGCTVHFEYEHGEARLDEVMVLFPLGDKVSATVFTRTSDAPWWSLVPFVLLVDPETLPDAECETAADCFEMQGFTITVTSPDELNMALSTQVEFLHRIIAELNATALPN
jgi:hypothetical protein